METNNVYKMRSTLEWIESTLSERIRCNAPISTEELYEMSKKAHDVLCAPPRNCDLYPNYGDAIRAFDELEDAERYEDASEWLFDIPDVEDDEDDEDDKKGAGW